MKTNRRTFLSAATSCGLGSLAGGAPRDSHGAEPAGAVIVPERKVPVLAEADVVVCGGGTAGISAAYCAARHGAKVILLERWPSLGGMATNAPRPRGIIATPLCNAV